MIELLEQILIDTPTDSNEEDTTRRIQTEKDDVAFDAENNLLRGVVDQVAGRCVDQLVEKVKGTVKKAIKDCTGDKKAIITKVTRYVVDENDFYEVCEDVGKNEDTDGAAGKNEDEDSSETELLKNADGSTAKIVHCINMVKMVHCINKRVADQFADLVKSVEEKECLHEKNVKRKKNKTRGPREIKSLARTADCV